MPADPHLRQGGAGAEPRDEVHMTAHQSGKWGRVIGNKPQSRLPQQQCWCYMCRTAHRFDEACRDIGKKRIEQKAR